VLAYLGAFTLQFREQQIASWVKRLLDLQMTCSEDFTLTKVLGEAVEIRQWNFCGLSSDMFSVETAIILK
jgi:dynein heavy chain